MEQLLGLWDLTDDDVQVDTAGLWNTTTTDTACNSVCASENNGREATETPSNRLEHNLCEGCYAFNMMDANWCIECGRVLIEKLSDRHRATDVDCFAPPKPDDCLLVSTISGNFLFFFIIKFHYHTLPL